MKFTTTLVALTTAAAVSAAPVDKRTDSYGGITDDVILNYALTLEHLEDKFYREGLANYTKKDFKKAGFSDAFYTNLQEVSKDETTHVSFLTSVLTSLGYKPVAECVYSFPSTDAKSFVGLAAVLEGVGVTAYLGAAASIMNKAYLTAAGSILTVESRHSSYLRASLGQSPFPQPFDAPLDFNEVFSLASGFIVSCPKSNPPLPFKPFPALAAGMGPFYTGSKLTLSTAGKDYWGKWGSIYACFIAVTGPTCVPARNAGKGMYSVSIPSGFAGQSYVVLNSRSDMVTDDTIIAGPAIIEIS